MINMVDMKLAKAGLNAKRSLPLEQKILVAKKRITEYYDAFDGMVYVAFSGGTGSTVLLHLVKSMYPDVPGVFSDTGLEFPAIRRFAEKYADEIIRPKKGVTFKNVLISEGYPVISKQQARFIRDLQNPKADNAATRNLRLTGMNREGKYSPTMKLSKKWHKVVDSDLKVSEKCCDLLKKEPLHRYQKNSKRYPINGTMASESMGRERRYLIEGCNVYNGSKSMGRPLMTWTEQDICEYILKYGVDYCKEVYGDIMFDPETNKLVYTGEQRTGCCYCPFGAHLEPFPNRYERMKVLDPKRWEAGMRSLGDRGFGLKHACEVVGIRTGEETPNEEIWAAIEQRKQRLMPVKKWGEEHGRADQSGCGTCVL